MAPPPRASIPGTTWRLARTPPSCPIEPERPRFFAVAQAKARRVVDQYIDAAERSVRRVEEARERGRIADVAGLSKAVTPRAANSLRTLARASAPRAQIATLAPSSANASAIERPMPQLPPVTITFFL